LQHLPVSQHPLPARLFVVVHDGKSEQRLARAIVRCCRLTLEQLTWRWHGMNACPHRLC
jgi:hypothetical protein